MQDAPFKQADINDRWNLSEDGAAIRCRLKFDDFDQAFLLVGKLAEIAESMNHHPDINFGWGYCEVSLTTHAANQLTQKDFEYARLLDQLLVSGVVSFRE